MFGVEIEIRHTAECSKTADLKSGKANLVVSVRLFYVKQFVCNSRYPAYDHSGDPNSHFIAL